MINLDLLNQKLKQKNLKQKDLADMLNIHKSAITAWKSGVDPKVKILVQICEILDVSADDMLGLNTKPPNKPDMPTPEEKKLLDWYRAADRRGKETIKNIAESEAKRKE